MRVEQAQASAINDVNFDQLVFGKNFTDHMIVCEYENGAWGELVIQPLQSASYHPATHAFHYGQAVFEGLKAYSTDDGKVNLFRIKDNLARLNLSAQRMAMPSIDEEAVLQAILKWIELDKQWVPGQTQGTLYIRPFMIATSPTLRAIPSLTYRFMLIASPVGFYYDEPIRIKVESHYSRAVQGGVGYAKAAGNYGAGFMPSALAKHDGFDQLLWTDRSQEQYLEELGSANVFMVVEGVVYTPELHDSILAGITRDTVIHLLRSNGIEVQETKIAKQFLAEQLAEGKVDCVFATGTAAAITFIREIDVDQKLYQVSSDQYAPVLKIKQLLEDVKFNRSQGLQSWNYVI